MTERDMRYERRRRQEEEERPKEKGIKRFLKKENIKWLVFALFFIYICIMLLVQQPQINALRDKNAELRTRVTELENEIERLEGEKEYVGSDEYIEHEAREQFGYVKDDEIIFKETP